MNKEQTVYSAENQTGDVGAISTYPVYTSEKIIGMTGVVNISEIRDEVGDLIAVEYENQDKDTDGTFLVNSANVNSADSEYESKYETAYLEYTVIADEYIDNKHIVIKEISVQGSDAIIGFTYQTPDLQTVMTQFIK